MRRNHEDMVNIIAVGDIMLGEHPLMIGRGMSRYWGCETWDPFANVHSFLNQAELVIGNLECVLSSKSSLEGYKGKALRAPPELAKALSLAGFRVLNVANNHSLDHGYKAFEDTCQNLVSSGIDVCGLPSDPVLINTYTPSGSKRRVAVIGASFQLDATSSSTAYRHVQTEDDLEKLCCLVEETTSLADIVLVSCHWGDEFVMLPSPKQLAFSVQLMSAGTDVLLGHHPHVYQGIDSQAGSWVFYSLGNFITDMSQRYLRIGAMGHIKYKNGDIVAESIPIRIDETNRPYISRKKEDTQLMKSVDNALEKTNEHWYHNYYSQLQKKMHGIYKRDIRIDFAKNALLHPFASIEIAFQTLRDFLGRVS